MILGAGALVVCAGVAAYAVFPDNDGATELPVAEAAKNAKPVHDPCAAAPSAALGVVASLRDNVGAAGGASGYGVSPLLTAPDKVHPAVGAGRLVIIAGSQNEIWSSAESMARAMRSNAAFTDAGAIPIHSQDRDLCSINYQLDDKPDAKALIAPARDAMIDGGFSTQAVLDDPGMTWAVTDNALDAGQVIVTAGVPGKPDVRPALGAPKNIYTTQAISAFVDRSTQRVSLVGFTPFYDQAPR
jgi:hypothetical protein